MHFVAALDQHPEMKCVLCLFEGVATGAADGYARMTGKPAATLLHTGPGLANGLANLHNAKRAFTPLVNIVGDHATYHLQQDSPLTSDIPALAGLFSHWVKSAQTAAEVAACGAEADRQPDSPRRHRLERCRGAGRGAAHSAARKGAVGANRCRGGDPEKRRANRLHDVVPCPDGR